MRLDKKVKELPWPDYQALDNPRIHFRTFFRWPVVKKERLLCIDFQRNRSHKGYFTPGNDFRLVLSKKQKTVRVLYKGETRARRILLQQLLHGFGTGAAYCYPEISKKDEAALKRWLGLRADSANHYMPELEKWVMTAIDREVLAEKDARGELRDEDVHLCPEELPTGFTDFIRREVLPTDLVLLYKKGNVRGRCFACGAAVRANAYQRFRQSETTKCPHCYRVVTAYLETSDRFKVDYVDNIAALQLGKDGKTVFFRQWHLLRDTTAQWENIEGQLKEIARYAVRGDKVAKWQIEFKHNYFMNTWRECSSRWVRTQDISRTYDGSYQFYLPTDWRQQLAGTSLRYIELEEYYNSKWDYYAYRNIIRFAMDWARYPAVEKLWKAGYQNFVHLKVFGTGQDYRNTIRWRADTVASATGISLRWLKIREPKEWDVYKLRRTQQILGEVDKGNIKETEVPLIERSDVPLDTIRLALGHASVEKILRYLEKEAATEKERYVLERAKVEAEGKCYYRSPSASPETYGTYRDYLRDCEHLNLDLNDQAVLFPNDLEAAHARTIEQVKHQENKEKRKAFARSVKKLEKLCMERNGFLIRPAASAKELIEEGKYLHHCVGGYADRMASGVLAIMLIRRADDPDTPFYTLEWKDKKVVQCKTMRNDDYRNNPQVEAFVNAWVRWVLGGCKKNKTTKVA